MNVVNRRMSAEVTESLVLIPLVASLASVLTVQHMLKIYRAAYISTPLVILLSPFRGSNVP